MISQPGQRVRSVTFHCDFRQSFSKLLLIVSNPAVSQNDVGIQNLTSQGMNAAWANCGPDVVIQPANKIVLNVFRILVHVGVRCGVLIVDFDRIGDANLFKRCIPGHDPVAHPTAITHRSCVFDVEYNRILGRAQLQLWIGLLQMPAIHIANMRFAVIVFRQINIRRGEESYAAVGDSRLITGVVRNITDRIVQHLQHVVVGGRNFERDFNVVLESFRRLDGIDPAHGEPHVHASRSNGTARRIAEQHCVHIDDGTATRSHRDDWNFHDNLIGKQPFDRRSGFTIPIRADGNVGCHQGKPLVVLTPVDVDIASL